MQYFTEIAVKENLVNMVELKVFNDPVLLLREIFGIVCAFS